MAKYRAKGGRLTHDMAQVFGRVMEELGNCTPADILRYARPKRSSIHSLFEWDDSLAAERFRLAQAGYYARSIEIVIEHPNGATKVNAFHSVVIDVADGEKKRAYCSLAEVRQSDELTGQVIENAKRDLRAFSERYKNLRSELGGVIEVINEFLNDEPVSKRRRLREAV
jgi:hypothetical protein